MLVEVPDEERDGSQYHASDSEPEGSSSELEILSGEESDSSHDSPDGTVALHPPKSKKRKQSNKRKPSKKRRKINP